LRAEKGQSRNYGFITLLVLFFVSGICPASVVSQENPASVEAPASSGILDTFFPVEGLSQWQHIFDISGLEPGTYNVLLRGRDAAGNTAEGEAVDIQIEPDSDLPFVTVTYPGPDKPVRGEINILGSAGDDDGIEYVEVKIDDGPYNRAEGGEYWSYGLSVDSLPDGEHSIFARPVDLNGTPGNELRVAFFIDKTPPVIVPESHSNGALVSGKITVAGRVEDLNGLAGFSYTTDREAGFEESKLKGDLKEGSGTFSFDLDTRKLPDGLTTIHFECRDLQGSVGSESLHLYVDNSYPRLDILYPPEELNENGRFSVAGRVFDEVGLESFSYIVKGGEPRAVELLPGNPFYSVDLDYTGAKQTDLEFLLTDTAGNTEEYTFKRQLAWEQDLPRVELLSPVDGEPVPQKRLRGWVIDDDGAKGIIYSFDKGEERRLERGEVFDISLADFRPGEHSLTIRGLDIHGTEGEPRGLSFIIPAGPPEVRFLQVSGKDVLRDFTPGMEIAPLEINTLSGTLRFESGSGDASYSLPDGTVGNLPLKKIGDDGEFSFQLKIPGPLPAGFFPVDIQAADSFSEKVYARAGFWVDDPAGPEGAAGIYPLSSGTGGKEERFSAEEPLLFLLSGGTAAEARLDGADGFSAAVSGAVISVTAQRQASASGVRLNVSTREGADFSYGPFDLSGDSDPPEWTLKAPEAGYTFASEVVLSGSLDEEDDVETIEYSLGTGSFRSLELLSDGTESGGFSVGIPLEGVEDGPLEIKLRAVDASGNIGEAAALFIKDSTSPTVEQILPEADEPVNGLFSLIVDVRDSWAQSFSGELIMAGQTLSLNIRPGQNSIAVDLSPFEAVPEDLALRILDTAGNETLFKPVLLLDAVADKPQIVINEPSEGGLVTGAFRLVGIVTDDDGVSGLEYRIDEDEFEALPFTSNFDLELSLERLTDNEHRIEMRAVDIGGVQSEPAAVRFNVSLDEPEARMSAPQLGTTSRGTVELSGTASDKNGIAEVFVSLDNGNTYQKASGEEEWSYILDSTLLVDGSYMVLIKVIDGFGVEGLYSSLLTVDNTPPGIELSSPGDGEVLRDRIPMQLRVSDDLAVDKIEYTLKPLAGTEEPAELEGLSGTLEVGEVVLTDIDLAGMSAGRYNLSIYVYDKAGNEATVSRNIVKAEVRSDSRPVFLFPLRGAKVQGLFTLEGRVEGEYLPDGVTLLHGGEDFDVLEVQEDGYFSRRFEPGELEQGLHTFQVRMPMPGSEERLSGEIEILYEAEGPWVHIDSLRSGGYVSGRPWVEGRAGYYRAPAAAEEGELSKKELKDFELSMLEYSLDNGRRFLSFKPREEWKFRLEARQQRSGPLSIIVRATFRNNETALTRVHVNVDNAPPSVAIVTPEEGMAFNEVLRVTGTAFDENGLEDVSVMLRKGSKSSHELPQFVQGLYLDTHFLGATTWEIGAGLTFFDDNVRLQAMFGQSPEGRFNGTVFGLKLLANVASLPYGHFFGPDFEIFSSSLAIGSSFQYFTMTESASEQSGLVLGALIAQLELLKVEFPERKSFNAVSLYVENQLWFISSDIEGGLEDRIAFGLRLNIF
jgi:Bacterial Ig domain/Bacterial Ig-like domain